MEDKVIYYPIGGCPICADMFKDFFIFCVQNKIDYEFKKNAVIRLSKPAIKWDDTWFIGDDALDKFKESWTKRKGTHVF